MLRRTFLIGAAIAGGGLLVGGIAASREWDNPLLAEGALGDGSVPLTPFVSVDPDGAVTIYAPRAEMGQGIHTTLAAFVAEELGLTLDDISVQHGPASGAYYNAAMLAEGGPFAFFNERLVANAARSAFGAAGYVLGLQVTGGSSSTRDGFLKMREAGAAALHVLRDAAAEALGVAPDALIQQGRSFAAGTETIGFGAVAANAATRTLPRSPALTPPERWRLLGTSQPRVDVVAKSTGTATYGIDVSLPGMLHAAVVLPPLLGTGEARIDKAAALAIPGVTDVVDVTYLTRPGFAVLASNTWASFKGAEALSATWQGGDVADTAALIEPIEAALETGEGFSLEALGDAEAVIEAAPGDIIVEARYGAPFLAHATLEPMNATALVEAGRCEIWTGTQAPTIARSLVADAVGIEAENVLVHTQLLGGGFGRRGESDFAVLAAQVAAAVEGTPVKVTWSREADMTHDFYRPAARARYRAVVENGVPQALHARIAAPSTIRSMMERTYANLPVGGPDRLIVEGAFDQPYAIADVRVEGIDAPSALPVGFWRAVGNSHNAFFHESFIDECAHGAGRDPLDVRLELAEPWPAATGALRRVAAMADWGSVEPDRAKGLAFCLSFGAWTAQVVEIEDRDGMIAITRAWCAVDVGTALDPANIASQLRGGMLFGLSAAVGQEVTVEDGAVQPTNYDGYDALRIGQAPPIAVDVLATHHAMGGAGEPGVPPAAPALANAVFALTGKRLRDLPLDREVSFVGW